MSATSLWNISGTDFPTVGSPRQKLGFALKYAALAPTEGRWQPWEFRMADTHLELVARTDPAVEAVDPDGREPIIGCGSALHYLKRAMKHFGCLGRVELFPDLGKPSLVARVHHGFSRERDPQEGYLFEAMTGNPSHRPAPGGNLVSEPMLTALSRAVGDERGWLDFLQSETSRQQVLKITVAGDQWWLNFDGSRPRPINSEAFEPAQQSSAPTTTLAIVKTKTDDKHGWLAAGQTMARTVLQARALGISWEFFNPVRRREARAALRMGVGHKGFAQVILRFGSLMAENVVRETAPTTATATFR